MRRPLLALAFALYAVGFAAVSAYIYWDFFFRHAGGGAMQLWTTDLVVPVANERWAVAPLSRLALSAGIFAGLAWCTWAFHRGDPRARIVGFLLSFGWLAPQARLLEEYLEFVHLAPWQAWLGAATLVLAPAAALSTPSVVRAFAPHEDKLPWAKLAWGRGRLVAVGVLLAWSYYLVDMYLAAWPWFGPWLRDQEALGLCVGVAGAVLSLVSFFGLLRLRTWSLLGALSCGAITAWGTLLIRRGSLDAGYVGVGVGHDWVASPLAVLLAFLPLTLFVALTWPILRAMGRRLLGRA
jgi:hypothetical protein